MAKWADYIITGIWTSDGHISHVSLHPDDGESDLSMGQKRTRAYAIALIKSGRTVVTGKWNYNTGKWVKGEVVSWFTRNGVEYLRTHPDEGVADNLGMMLNMGNFPS